MLKSPDQMRTRLSQLPKDLSAWFPSSLLRNLRSDQITQDGSDAEPARGSAEQFGTDRPLPQPQDSASGAADLNALLEIPTCTSCPDAERRLELQNQGQFLARQELWAELLRQIEIGDQQNRSTPSGLPEADLLAYGARADVINAVEHALEDSLSSGRPLGQNRVLIDGIMALESLRREHKQNPYLTALVALSHIDIAWIWRGRAATDSTPSAHANACLRRASAHFERAEKLLAPLQDTHQDSAFLLATQCALYAGHSANTMQVADAYGRLIDQNPTNPRHMRALGAQMLPRANGSYGALELEARRSAARTQDEWGAGGYTWVYFDAIAIDAQACARVDKQFFMDGIQDILSTDSSQEMVNLLAAYCAVTLRKADDSDPEARATRQSISRAARWLIRSHLHELHPMIWAHASEGFDNNARVPSLRRFTAHGHSEALNCIAQVFRDEIDSGHKIAFSAKGFAVIPV